MATLNGDRESEGSKPALVYTHGSSPFLRARSAVTLEELPEPPEWVGDALCAQSDPEQFFPEKGGTTRYAKKICGDCEVRQQCLAYALENEERFGIWGGKSERERRKIARGEPLVDRSGAQRARSERERDVTRLNAEGLTDKAVAARLGLSVHTAGVVRKSLGLPRNTDLVPKLGRGRDAS